MKITKAETVELKDALKQGFDSVRTAGIRKSSGDSTIEVVKENYSFSKWLRGTVLNDWTNASIEKSMFSKALGQDNGTTGGFLVPTQTNSEIIELLTDTAQVRTMPGVRVIDMETDKMVLNRSDTAPVVSWGSESAQISEDTTMTFGQVSLELNKCVCLYKISRELLQNANASVDQLVIQELTTAVDLAEDKAFLEGTGGTQPLGFYYHPKVNSTDLSATIGFADILEGMYIVEKDKGQINGWVSHPRTKHTLRTLVGPGASDTTFIYADGKNTDASNANMGTLYGAPVKFTTQIPITMRPASNESYIVGGQWSNMLIGQKPELRIETSTVAGNAFEYDQIYIKVVRYVDMALRHPETFTVIKGIQA